MSRRNKAILFGLLAQLSITLAAVGVGAIYSPIPIHALYFIALNLVTFLSFGQDKWAAQNHKSRTPEMVFHLLGFLGAFPAIFIARKVFKHKTQKQSYIRSMWLFFILQISVVFYLFSF